jgi:hypothetical protein
MGDYWEQLSKATAKSKKFRESTNFASGWSMMVDGYILSINLNA